MTAEEMLRALRRVSKKERARFIKMLLDKYWCVGCDGPEASTQKRTFVSDQGTPYTLDLCDDCYTRTTVNH